MTTTISAALNYLEYSDSVYTYSCEAPVSSSVDSSVWRVKRTHKTDKSVEWANEGTFTNKASSISHVSKLIYQSAIVSLSKISASLGQALSYNGAWYNFDKNATHIYGARGTKGVSVLDISDISNISEVDTAVNSVGDVTRDVALIDSTTLVTASRGTNGSIETFDISNPAAIVLKDTYVPVGTEKYSALDTDGSYIYAAGQLAGLFVFDVSNPAAIALHGSLTTGTWETQGIAVKNGYAFMANYNNGLRIVDIANPASPGAVTDISIASPVIGGDTMRIWEVVADDNYVYACCNVTTSLGDSVNRSLLILPIDNVPTLTSNDWIIASIPANDHATWNNQGDMPYLSLYKLDNYVYMAAGNKGIFIFEVSDPRNPRYLGVISNNSKDDNISSVIAYRDDDKSYLIYGDGVSTNEGTHQLYVDEIIKI